MPIVLPETTPSFSPTHRSSQFTGGTWETTRKRMRSGCKMPNRFAVVICSSGSGTPILRMVDSCRRAQAHASGRITVTKTDMGFGPARLCFFDGEGGAVLQSIRQAHPGSLHYEYRPREQNWVNPRRRWW